MGPKIVDFVFAYSYVFTSISKVSPFLVFFVGVNIAYLVKIEGSNATSLVRWPQYIVQSASLTYYYCC